MIGALRALTQGGRGPVPAELKARAIQAVARRLNLEIVSSGSNGTTTALARRPGSSWGSRDRDSDVELKAFLQRGGVRVETWDGVNLTDVFVWKG